VSPSGGCLPGTDKFYLNTTIAHEIGHNLGLRHATKGDPNLDCGAKVSGATANWPYNDSTIQQPGYDPIKQVFKPNSKADFMSYCSPPGSNVWISPFDYHQLFGSGFQPHIAAPTSSEATAAAPDDAPSQMLVISGTVSEDGTTGSLD
jgi:hypothetical protein